MFDETGDLVWSATHYVWGAVRAVKMYGGGAGAATAWSDGGSINGGGTNGAVPARQGKQGASLVPARERAQAEGAARELICPFRFPGQYEDVETGLNYNRHRYYDALTGQYCSPDPIGLAGGDRPQGYVDRPGSWVDPLGLKAAAGGANYMKPDDAFKVNASRRSDIDPNGQFDVIAHGNQSRMVVETSQGPIKLNAKNMAKLIKVNPQYKKGQPVRLLSCETGACKTGMGQSLANKLRAPVTAPTDTLWAHPNGAFTIGPNASTNSGIFKTFFPK